MRLCGCLRNPKSGLIFLITCLSTSCVQLDSPVEPAIPEGPLAVSRSRETMQINEDGILVQVDVPAPMRDGVHLLADVYLPNAVGPFPVILT